MGSSEGVNRTDQWKILPIWQIMYSWSTRWPNLQRIWFCTLPPIHVCLGGHNLQNRMCIARAFIDFHKSPSHHIINIKILSFLKREKERERRAYNLSWTWARVSAPWDVANSTLLKSWHNIYTPRHQLLGKLSLTVQGPTVRGPICLEPITNINFKMSGKHVHARSWRRNEFLKIGKFWCNQFHQRWSFELI